MKIFRHLLARRHMAVLICSAAMLLRLLMPTGYMMTSDHGRPYITICSGMATAPTATGMPGVDHSITTAQGSMPDPDKSTDHAKPPMSCAFAGLSAQGLDAVDFVLLGIALAGLAVTATKRG